MTTKRRALVQAVGSLVTGLLVGCAGAPAPPPAAASADCRREWLHLPVVFGFNPGGTEPNRHPDTAPHDELAADVVAAARAREVLLVRTEGHIDPCGDHGVEEENATARAEAVRALLVERGLPPDAVRAEGFTDVSSRRDPSCHEPDAPGFVARVEVSFVICDAEPAGGVEGD